MREGKETAPFAKTERGHRRRAERRFVTSMKRQMTESRPGDAVRQIDLQRGGDFGSIRIQRYGLPGDEESWPGDTPKVWPEWAETFTDNFKADECFDRMVQQAFTEGWHRTYTERQL